MRITGWTVPELRRQPARVVRAHFARIFAERVWNPQLAEAARSMPPSRSSYPDLASYGKARMAQMKAAEALAAIERALWPEGD
jgi:hypothetical protein